MESLIQEIYDEIGSCQLSNNTKNEILVNNANIEQLEKEYPTDWVSDAESGDLRRCSTINAAKYAGDVKFAHQMCMDILLRDKKRLNIQIKQIDDINNTPSRRAHTNEVHQLMNDMGTNEKLLETNEELLEYINYLRNNQGDKTYNTLKTKYEKVPHVKNTDVMDLPECNYVAIRNKLNGLNSETVKNNQEIIKLKNAFDVAHTDKYDKNTKLGRPSNWWSTSNVYSCRSAGGRAYKNSLETLLRNKERLKVQLDHTNKIWEKYNYDTQRIAQNHEIEQLKVTMALMMKSQEKLELKNKELEDQIKEATDRQNQRWWQRS